MLTLLWLYLATNKIINMGGVENLIVLLTLATFVADVNLIGAVCDRIRGKYK